MRRLVPFAVLLTGLVLASGASAATPFTVGDGVNPKISVAPNGTGYVVWGIPPRGMSTDGAIGFCRIPKGADACDRTFTLPYPDGGSQIQTPGNVTVTAESNTKIRVTGSCWQCVGSGSTEAVQRYQSNDGGATAPLAEPGLGATPTTSGVGPDGISVQEGANNPFVTNAGGERIIARPGSTGEIDPVTGFLFVYSPSLVQVPGTQKLVYAVNDLGTVKYAVYTGAGFSAGALMTQGNWLTDQTLPGAEPDSQETKLNAGPSGTYLTYRQSVPIDDHLLLRKFDPATNTFGAARALEGSSVIDAGVDYPSSSQDGAGRVHVVWRSLYDTKRLRYTVSDPTGTTFSAPADLAQNDDFFLNPEVGAGPDGQGWAVWQGNGDTPIRVVRIDPYPDPGETPPPSGGGTTPITTPTPSAPGTRRVVSTVPGASITFGVPSGCVQPGSTFKVTLSWKRKKKKGNKFVKVTRADFYVGTKVVKKDKKAPFVQTLRVTASAKRGSTINLRARAFIKVKKGKAPKKSIKAQIKVCP